MPLFHKNLFKILVSRVESRNERQNLSKCFRFVCVLRDENCNSAKISSTRSGGQPCSIRRIRENSFFFNSTDFLTEFVLSKHTASPFTKLFITLRSAAFCLYRESLPQPASLFKNVTSTSYTGELVGKTCQIFPSALPNKTCSG